MKYHSHVEVIQKKFSQLAGLTFRMINCLDLKSAKILYFAFVYLRMTYWLTA